MRYAALALFVVGCGGSMPGSTVMSYRVKWDTEPVICTEEPELVPYIKHAVRSWGWVRYSATCTGANTVVKSDPFLEPGILGRANWEEGFNYCFISIKKLSQFVITHEIGHCIGLGHSQDRASVMYPTYDGQRSHGVTNHDRGMLEQIKETVK